MDHHSDENLARAVQQGSQPALEALVARYYPALLTLLFRLLGGRQSEAEDLVHDTFLRLMAGIASYDPERPFKPWIYTIARNLASTAAVRTRLHPLANLVDQDHYPDHLPLPEQSLLNQELQHMVLAGLQQLPFAQREAIVLFYYERMQQKEIAAMLDIPVGTVKSRISLGLKQLRRCLEVQQ